MALEFDPSQQRVLVKALSSLAAGDTEPFQDALWLGFGDEWLGVVRTLRDHRIISLPNSDPRRSSLLPRGERYLEYLRGSLDKTPNNGSASPAGPAEGPAPPANAREAGRGERAPDPPAWPRRRRS